MADINFHHLEVFWTVAREGSASAAARSLGVAQPTVSAQVRSLERSVGESLFRRAGRGLELTATGRLVRAYCDDIFGLGRELSQVLTGESRDRPRLLRVGVAEDVPKLVAWRMLAPAVDPQQVVRLIARQDRGERLLAELRIHELDVVLAPEPAPPGGRVRLDSFLLDETPLSFFAATGLEKTYREQFPKSLEGAPVLLPAEKTALRRQIDAWFADRGLHPKVVGEFEDPALLKTFAGGGMGLCVAPTAIADDVQRQYGLVQVGRTDLLDQVYMITSERQGALPGALAAVAGGEGE